MEVLIIILFIILIILNSKRNNSLRREYQELSDGMRKVLKQVAELKEDIILLRRDAPRTSSETVVVPENPVVVPPTIVEQPSQPEPAILELPEQIRAFTARSDENTDATEPVTVQPKTQYQPVQSVSIWSKWMSANPDLEKFIGENLINKIGIGVLVLGIAFFVKYAIDQQWINEVGRVSIGIICGAILLGLAHYLRNSYRSFSSVLAGGGIAVFYFTIAFAFHQYQLISQTAAFLIMVLITGFAVALSLLYDKIELAVIAAVGGFITPFLVSTGEGNYIILFTYLIILNLGLLSLSYFKRWPLINVLALLFTILITGGWLGRMLVIGSSNISYTLALAFVSALYLIFLGMNMMFQLRYRKAFKKFDFSLLLLLTASYYAAGMILLSYVQAGRFQGLFTIATGVVNLSLAWMFFKRKDVDRNLLYLLIGFTLTFISLAVPVQLKGHTITIFWCAEMVLLYWLFQRSGIRLFKLSSLIIGALSIISLILDYNNAEINSNSALALIFIDIRGLITNVFASVAFAAYAYLLSLPAAGVIFFDKISANLVRRIFTAIALGLLYITLIFGVNLYFAALQSYEVPNVYHQLVTILMAIFLFFTVAGDSKNRVAFKLSLVAYAFLFYLFSTPLIHTMRIKVESGAHPQHHLWLHWLSSFALLYLAYIAIRLVQKSAIITKRGLTVSSWIFSIGVVIILSIEAFHVYMSIGNTTADPEIQRMHYMKAMLTILWSVCSFVIMWLGMKRKNKTLRIISLSLFSLSLIKLFFFDIRNISEGGKIAAFILLGVLLLTISFMYQKLKKIIIDEAKG